MSNVSALPLSPGTLKEMVRSLLYIAVFGLLFCACRKDKVELDNMHLIGVTNEKAIEVNLKSGTSREFNIGCYVFTSCVYDKKTNGYGYVSCDSVFHLFDPNTGKSIINFPLPALLSEVTIDTSQYEIIGLHWIDTIAYVLRADLSNGDILSDNQISLGGDVNASMYFFNPSTNLYNILRIDSTLLSIDPNTGTIVNQIPFTTLLTTTIYDPENEKLIGVSYINSVNYVSVVDIHTGALDSQYEIEEQFTFFGNVASYDPLTNSLILVNNKLEVKFIDINSGQITDTYPIGYGLTELQFWRDN